MRRAAAGLAASWIGLMLAACASLPGSGPSDAGVTFAEVGVIVPVDRGFEVVRQGEAEGAVQTVAFRRPSSVRGSFENCTIRVLRAPAGSTVTDVAVAAATRRYEKANESGALTNVTLAVDRTPRVVTSDFTIERTMRTRERFWGVARADRVWLVQQDCQTVGSPQDLLALEAATAPAFQAAPDIRVE